VVAPGVAGDPETGTLKRNRLFPGAHMRRGAGQICRPAGQPARGPAGATWPGPLAVRLAMMLVALLAVLLAAACSAGPAAPYRPTAGTCYAFAVRAIQRHAAVAAVPGACAGPSPSCWSCWPRSGKGAGAGMPRNRCGPRLRSRRYFSHLDPGVQDEPGGNRFPPRLMPEQAAEQLGRAPVRSQDQLGRSGLVRSLPAEVTGNPRRPGRPGHAARPRTHDKQGGAVLSFPRSKIPASSGRAPSDGPDCPGPSPFPGRGTTARSA
jgi:hypothetical protein